MIGFHLHTRVHARKARVCGGVGELGFPSLVLFIALPTTLACHVVAEPSYFRNFLPPYVPLPWHASLCYASWCPWNGRYPNMHAMSIHVHWDDGNAHEMMSMNSTRVHGRGNKGYQSKLGTKIIGMVRLPRHRWGLPPCPYLLMLVSLFIPICKEKCSIKIITRSGVWMTGPWNAGIVKETTNFGLLELKTTKTQVCKYIM
jgi:hypothetical protein